MILQSMHVIASRKITEAISADPTLTVKQLSQLVSIRPYAVKNYLIERNLPVNEPDIEANKKAAIHEPIFEFNTWQIGEQRAYLVEYNDKNTMQSYAHRRCFSGWKKPYKRIFTITTRYIEGKLIVTRIA